MATGRQAFSGAAVKTTLTSNQSSSDTLLNVGSTAGWPNTATGPFVITINRGALVGSEEKVLISSYTSTQLTVAASGRGYDGTNASAHSSGEIVEHTIDSGVVDQVNKLANTLGTVVPTTSAVGDSGAGGSSATGAAADHRHGREA